MRLVLSSRLEKGMVLGEPIKSPEGKLLLNKGQVLNAFYITRVQKILSKGIYIQESPEEARMYLTELRNILRYIDVCDGNLEEGSLRCDCNISVRPKGDPLGTKVEIKTINTFRFVENAIEFHYLAR